MAPIIFIASLFLGVVARTSSSSQHDWTDPVGTRPVFTELSPLSREESLLSYYGNSEKGTVGLTSFPLVDKDLSVSDDKPPPDVGNIDDEISKDDNQKWQGPHNNNSGVNKAGNASEAQNPEPYLNNTISYEPTTSERLSDPGNFTTLNIQNPGQNTNITGPKRKEDFLSVFLGKIDDTVNITFTGNENSKQNLNLTAGSSFLASENNSSGGNQTTANDTLTQNLGFESSYGNSTDTTKEGAQLQGYPEEINRRKKERRMKKRLGRKPGKEESSLNEIDADKSDDSSDDVFSDVVINESVVQKGENVIVREFRGSCKEKGFQFENSYLTLNTNKFSKKPTNDLTFFTWLRIRRVDRESPVYSTNAADGAPAQSLVITPADASVPNAGVRWTIKPNNPSGGASPPVITVSAVNLIPAGIWTHLVARYDGKKGQAYIYVNGNKMTAKEVPKTASLVWGPEVLLGGLKEASAKPPTGLTGSMLKIRFVEKPMTKAEIEAIVAECTPKNGGIPYLITVCTSTIMGSSTSSGVFLQIKGVEGHLGEFKVGEDFKRGCSMVVTVDGPLLGDVKSLSIRKAKASVTSLHKDWTLDKIIISSGTYEETDALVFTFQCNPVCKFVDSDPKTWLQTLSAKPEVNGGWSEWSEWSGCGSGMCGGDKKVKTRSCTKPVPSEGGKKCTLPDVNKTAALIETMEEPCKVDGGWGSWSPWTECAQICGGSIVERIRVCDNPAPANGGAKCPGPDKETKEDCKEPCEDVPINGGWSEWEAWSPCAKTCGGSTVMRKRVCTNPAPNDHGLPCEGDDTESATDCTNHCPVDGGWGEWSEWTRCSTSCGPGKKTRDRKCNNPEAAYGGKCVGDAQETDSCKLFPCPNAVDGNWGPWGPYSECTEKTICLQGTRARKRKCDKPAPSEGGDDCPGLDSDEEVCPTKNCKPLNGDSISVKPDSFLAQSCQASTGFFATGTKSKDIPASIFGVFLKDIKTALQTSYFATKTETKKGEEITKYCFQPSAELTIGSIQKAFPEYASTSTLPSYDKPAVTELSPGVAVEVKKDGTLYAAEFMMGESDSYSPMVGVTLKNVRFWYRKESGSRGIFAYGQQEYVNSEFTVKVSAGPTVTGSSTKGVTDAATIMTTLAFPVSTAVTGLKDQLLKFVIDHLTLLALAKVPINDLSEAATLDTKRISGSFAWEGKDVFYVEAIKKTSFAIGFTSDKTAFRNLVETIVTKLSKSTKKDKDKKGLELFGEMRDVTVGLAYAHGGFDVSSDTTFTREPLKTELASSIKQGVFVAARMRLPEACKGAICNIAHHLIGKDNWIRFSGNIMMTGFEMKAMVQVDKNENNTNKARISEVQIFIKLEKWVTFSAGIGIAVAIPIDGNIFKDDIPQPKNELTLRGTLSLSSTLTTVISLKMSGIWRNAFGRSYLSIADLGAEIGITATGLPSKIALSGTVILGRDCFFAEDFAATGSCLQAAANVQLSPTDITNTYFYGSLKAVTFGKVFRMLDSKLQLPKRLADTGFEEGVVVSFAFKEQTIQFAGKSTKVMKGLYINGKINLLGFSTALILQLSTDVISVDVTLGVISLPGDVKIFKSIQDEKSGPRFKVNVTRTPLSAEITLQGAMNVFGIKTGISFIFKPSAIQAEFSFTILNSLTLSVLVKGAYGSDKSTTKDDKNAKSSFGFKGISFTANVTIATVTLQNGTKADVSGLIENARTKLQAATEKVRVEKENCKKSVATHCDLCQKIVCSQVTSACNEAYDEFKNYIGKAVDKGGRWVKDVSKQFLVAVSKKQQRKRRSTEPFTDYIRDEVRSHVRKKRFVGKYLCTKIAKKICGGSKKFCKASCKMTSQITKGVCKSLDFAQKSLHFIEQGFYWVQKAQAKLADTFTLNSISFQTELSSALKASVSAKADVTIFQVRRVFDVTLSLDNLKKMALIIASRAVEEFKKIVSPRFSKPLYDNPGNEADYVISAPFRIQNVGSEMCMKSSGETEGSHLPMAACEGDATLWLYTLTGELMNKETGLCLTVSGSPPNLKVVQMKCKVASTSQQLECEWNRLFSPQHTENCFMEKADTVSIAKCPKIKITENTQEQATENTQEQATDSCQEWRVHNDPRKKVCDYFVKDLSFNKPATQSSRLTEANLDNSVSAEEKRVYLNSGPELAVNGDMSSRLPEGSCAHTASEKDPWWRVDLQDEYIVTDVSLQSAMNGYLVEALSNFEIRVGMATDFKRNPMCGQRVVSTHLGELWTSQCEPAIPGRYVSVQKFGEAVSLTLCEVAVFARKDNSCSIKLQKKRNEITSYKGLAIKRASVTYGYYH
ncbi:uncharacterized protein LOC5511196 [Nematostella vectensis]|uniref:uncharacterized protein LOC5511196 n=1 Tax=Nematostella vectensis TaxID=45351 RepID=UPI002077799F|nr:uncharacterized protein LOC5511196 [Nematostella vectensis]